jgi:hypothetical protein
MQGHTALIKHAEPPFHGPAFTSRKLMELLQFNLGAIPLVMPNGVPLWEARTGTKEAHEVQ